MSISRSNCRLSSVVFASFLVVSTALADEYRTWTDSTGAHKVRGKLESVENGKAILVREDGKKQKIALEKLSKADRDFIAKQELDSPFESVDDESGQPTKQAAEPSGNTPRVVKVSWDDSQEVLLESGESDWKIDVPETPPAEFRPKSIPLPGKKDFFEGMTGIAFSRAAKAAVIGYALDRHKENKTVRLVACDLQTGRMTAQVSLTSENLAPIALHDDGQQILMCRNDFGHGTHNRLEIWTIKGKGVVRSVVWTPYEEGWEPHRDVSWAEFINAEKLATCSSGGKIAIWNLATMQPTCHIQAEPDSIPCLSADRKMMAIVSKNAMGLFNIEKQEMITSQKTPRDLQGPAVAFSPSGRKIGCIAGDRIVVWDTATGALEKDFGLTGLHFFHRGIAFPDDEFVLVGYQYLIELKNQLKLWKFDGAEQVRAAWGMTFFGVPGDERSGLLMAAKLPQPEAKALLEKAIKQPDLFVFHKGTPVKLDVSKIPDAAEKTKAAESLTKKLAALNCPIQDTAQVSVVAIVEGPISKEVSFMHSGTYKVQEYRTRLKIVHAGQDIWEASWTNIPHILRIERGENIEGELRKASSKPSYGFYESVVLPEFLQKPASDKAAAGADQTLGATRLTPQGLLMPPSHSMRKKRA